MTRKSVFAILALLLTLSLGLLAQKKDKEDANTRSVQGVITDGGSPANGAVVQLKDMKTLQVRSFITHEDGAYHFAGLSTNVDYELKADYHGATSGTKTLSVFDNRKTAIMNLSVKK